MRKIKGILICLLVCTSRLMAIDYQPLAFGSTSAYRGESRASQQVMRYDRTQPTGSFTAISASNFETLNGEGGVFSPAAAAGPRRGRVGGGTEETNPGGSGEELGNYAVHSPVGDTPWLMMALLALSYIALRSFRTLCFPSLRLRR